MIIYFIDKIITYNMQYYSRRNSFTRVSEPQPTGSCPNTDASPFRSYRNQIRNTTPQKQRRILFANKENNSINMQLENKQLLETKNNAHFTQNPLKASGVYGMGIIQNSIRSRKYSRNTQNPPSYSREVTNNQQYRTPFRMASARKTQREPQWNRQDENKQEIGSYSSKRYMSRVLDSPREKIFERQAQTQRTEQKQYNKEPIQRNWMKMRNRSTKFDHLKKQEQSIWDQESYKPTTSPALTPKKSRLIISNNASPYLEKSQILKQRMQTIEKMTPRGSLYKTNDEPVKKQAQLDADSRKSITKVPQSHIQNQIAHQQYQKPDCNQGLQGIEQISQKISNRLKAIISQHQK